MAAAEACDRQLPGPGWLLSTNSIANSRLTFTASPSCCPIPPPARCHGEGLFSCSFGRAPGSLSEEVLGASLSAEGRSGRKAWLRCAQDTRDQSLLQLISFSSLAEALLPPTCGQIFGLNVYGCPITFPEHKPFSKQGSWWCWEGASGLKGRCKDFI